MSTDTPPCSAATWPSSDVPAPNGTIGAPCARQIAHDRGRLLGVARVDDDVGRGGAMPALVGPVPAPLVVAGDDAVGVERGDQLLLQPIAALKCVTEYGDGETQLRILLYRGAGAALEVLLVHPGGPFWAKKDLGAWSIPKGEHEDDEEALAAALREFEEETGHAPSAGELDDLGTVRQNRARSCRRGRWRATSTPTRSARTRSRCSGRRARGGCSEFPEVDRAAWFALDEARERINPAQAAFLDRLRERFES